MLYTHRTISINLANHMPRQAINLLHLQEHKFKYLTKM